jgi:hypothetical protein
VRDQSAVDGLLHPPSVVVIGVGDVAQAVGQQAGAVLGVAQVIVGCAAADQVDVQTNSIRTSLISAFQPIYSHVQQNDRSSDLRYD